jgi:hypothetical protein
MIGEAVPPQFTELHGRVLASMLDGRVPRRTMSTKDNRTRLADKQIMAISLRQSDEQISMPASTGHAQPISCVNA